MDRQELKISTLSFSTKKFEGIEADTVIQYQAFYYLVDGKVIENPNDEYNPINCYDIVDQEASEQNIVILWHCGCGIWGCSSLVAYVKELQDNIVEWDIKEYRGKDVLKKYYFRKDEYLKKMAEIKVLAEEEILIKLNRKR